MSKLEDEVNGYKYVITARKIHFGSFKLRIKYYLHKWFKLKDKSISKCKYDN